MFTAFAQHKVTPVGRAIASLSALPKNLNKKSPASLVQLRRAEVEKIGLASTLFGINLSPDCVNNKKKPRFAFQASQGECGEDRARTDDLLTASQAL